MSPKDAQVSSINEIYSRFVEFYSQETISLLNKYDLVEKLIGVNHHNPTTGYHCEMLLKEYLREKLPKEFSVDTGFVCCNPQEVEIHEDGQEPKICYISASPQIDILIHRESCCAPIYRTGDCVIIEPEAVGAIIEVKKNLTSTELNSALKNISDSFYVASWDRTFTPDRIFKGIFAFSSSLGKDGKKIKEILQNAFSQGFLLPNAIAVANKYFFNISYQNDGNYLVDHYAAFPRLAEKEGNEYKTIYPLQLFLFSMRDKLLCERTKKFIPFNFSMLHKLDSYILQKS